MDDVVFETQPEVLKGAWHQLCAGVMLQAVQRLASENCLVNTNNYRGGLKVGGGFCKERVHQKAEAREWIKGGVGLITYEDCCREMGVDPARAREKIMAWCRSKKRTKLTPPDFYGGGDDQEEG